MECYRLPVGEFSRSVPSQVQHRRHACPIPSILGFAKFACNQGDIYCDTRPKIVRPFTSRKSGTGRTCRFDGSVFSTRPTIVGVEAEYKIEKVSYRRIRCVLWISLELYVYTDRKIPTGDGIVLDGFRYSGMGSIVWTRLYLGLESFVMVSLYLTCSSKSSLATPHSVSS
jgi:hypothetical protein